MTLLSYSSDTFICDGPGCTMRTAVPGNERPAHWATFTLHSPQGAPSRALDFCPACSERLASHLPSRLVSWLPSQLPLFTKDTP